jgi:hypothetical protein
MGLVVTPPVTKLYELCVSRTSTSGLHLVRRIKMTGALLPCAFVALTAKHELFYFTNSEINVKMLHLPK